MDINTLKKQLKELIDDETEKLILDGFTYDGNKFSLSLEARSEWLALRTLESEMTFPITLPTLDGSSYSLSQANLSGFLTAGLSTYRSHKQSGRLLKEQVDTKTTEEDLSRLNISR
jgi:hypothetical protein